TAQNFAHALAHLRSDPLANRVGDALARCLGDAVDVEPLSELSTHSVGEPGADAVAEMLIIRIDLLHGYPPSARSHERGRCAGLFSGPRRDMREGGKCGVGPKAASGPKAGWTIGRPYGKKRASIVLSSRAERSTASSPRKQRTAAGARALQVAASS